MDAIRFSEYSHNKLELRKMQEKDPNTRPVYTWYVNCNHPHGNSVILESLETRYYWVLWDSLRLLDGLLYRRFLQKHRTSNVLQFIVPKCLRRHNAVT